MQNPCSTSNTETKHSNPFGMGMPTRSWSAAGENYRFGFNGQLQVDEVSGEGNHNTALFWEYDTRLGRRWNIDPKPNPSISEYATFNDNPILISDPNGDCGCGCSGKPPCPVPEIPKYEYTGGAMDYIKAVDNGIINILNIIPDVINSGYGNYSSLKNGTWASDVSGEFKQMGEGIADYASGSWNYTWTTPIDQQAVDTWNMVTSPQALELGTTLFIGSKLPLIGKTNAKYVEAASVNTGRTFAQIIQGAEDITFKKSVTNLKIDGSVQQGWGDLMKQYGKSVDDLRFPDSKTSYFTTNGGKNTYTLYIESSKIEGAVGLTIREQITNANGTQTVTKARFTQE